MRQFSFRVVVAVAVCCLALVGEAFAVEGAGSTGRAEASDDLVFEGLCDGSGAVILDGNVLVVATEASNMLKEYALEVGGKPISGVDLHGATSVHPRAHRNHSKFEALARVGDFVYVVGSHSRTNKGVNMPERKRILALEVVTGERRETLRLYGEAFHDLAESIEDSDALKRISLHNTIMSQYIQLPYLSPSQNGLDIHGLAAAPDGKGLLIGLRNPLRGRSAIVVPFENPGDVVVKFAAEPIFGEPILLNLEGSGVNSMEYSPARSSYLILSGSKGRKPAEYELFEWFGDAKSRPQKLEGADLSGLYPEGIVVSADGTRALVLSDDGYSKVEVEDDSLCRIKPKKGLCRCDDLTKESRRSFRARWIDLPSTSTPR